MVSSLSYEGFLDSRLVHIILILFLSRQQIFDQLPPPTEINVKFEGGSKGDVDTEKTVVFWRYKAGQPFLKTSGVWAKPVVTPIFRNAMKKSIDLHKQMKKF